MELMGFGQTGCFLVQFKRAHYYGLACIEYMGTSLIQSTIMGRDSKWHLFRNSLLQQQLPQNWVSKQKIFPTIFKFIERVIA